MCHIKKFEVKRLKTTKVRLIVFITIPVLLVSMLVMVLYLVSNADTYENIKIFEINGEVIIDRKNEDKIDTYENMNLISGDIITVSENSNAKLQLDDDKFALIEPNTKLEIEVAGQENNKKFKINLISGALITEIQNKLDANSSFDIHTPNSTMSVRGTVFRVEASKDSDGNYISNLQVYEGKVEVNINDTENSTIIVEKGKSAQVVSDSSTAKYAYTNKNLDISDLPDCSLEYLKKINDGGRQLSLNKLIEIEATTSVKTTEGEVITDDITSTDKELDNNKASKTGNSSNNAAEPEVTRTTVGNSQSPSNPAVTEPTNTPAVTEGTTKPPTVREGTTKSPTVTEGTTKPPTVTEATTNTTVTGDKKVVVTYNLGATYEPIHASYDYGDTAKPITNASIGNQQEIEGWYTDAALTNKWDFNQSVTQDMTLYAKYIIR